VLRHPATSYGHQLVPNGRAADAELTAVLRVRATAIAEGVGHAF
jgi:hypothetical protein